MGEGSGVGSNIKNMKNAFFKALRIVCTISICTVGGYTQTTATYNRVTVKDTLALSGSKVAEIVTDISATSKNNELPTAKAVYDEVQAKTVSTTARLSGNGTSGSPLDIAQQSATTGQVLRWSGSAWAPNGTNLYDIVTTSQTVAAQYNQVWVDDIGASITLNLPACNAANDKVKIDIAKAGADTWAVVIEPAGSEEFSDGSTSKTIYSTGTAISCTCRWTGSVGFWLFINM